MKKFRWTAILMIVAIVGITGFQGYWLKNNYNREWQSLQITTNSSFRQTILHKQALKLKLEKFNNIFVDTVKTSEVVVTAKKGGHGIARRPARTDASHKDASITLLNLLQEKMKDTFSSIMVRQPRMFADSTMRTRMLSDSGHGMAAISIMVDSLLKEPGRIENINVQTDKNSAGKIITIAVNKDFTPKRPTEVVKLKNVFTIDSLPPPPPGDVVLQRRGEGLPGPVFKFLYEVDSLSARDSLTVKDITAAYAARLKEDNIDVPFRVERLDSAQANQPNAVTIGFAKPVTFGLTLTNTFGYMLRKLKLPILFSLLLVTITIASFVLLYRNIIRQQRLAELKNEFISNITHELKTPIATVGVAIEALKNFNAIHDPARTSEYLDISQNELRRLNLLVDKVLKLSAFEKQQIELKKEWFDCRQMTEEVMASMRLQFEKYHANVKLETSGDNFMVQGDKMHITSVVYNLLDNALKYSKDQPVITVRIVSQLQHLELSVEDNGIGIPEEYKAKVFDKFFRVPTGDTHNAKGYGLGLSYVSEVLKRHHGFIEVKSESGKGSIFTAYLPYQELPEIQFDEHRRVIKKQLRAG